MSIKITDPALLDALRSAKGDIELTDADGGFVGFFTNEQLMKPPPGFVSKFSLEELERRRQMDEPEYSYEEVMQHLREHG